MKGNVKKSTSCIREVKFVTACVMYSIAKREIARMQEALRFLLLYSVFLGILREFEFSIGRKSDTLRCHDSSVVTCCERAQLKI